MRRNDREIKDREEIFEIVEKADVCRLALCRDNVPYIVAMNYGFDHCEPALYFHCAAEGKKLDIMAENSNVCFQMDIDHELIKGEQSCHWGMNYRSVVGMGKAQLITDKNEKIKGLDLIMEHYSAKGPFSYQEQYLNAMKMFKVTIDELTGKKRV
jgi:nitroimidazol reductase NimA-like FMN-containing flavoprotein (pyridoxamine 5'-phosphate oxidase superfamily)